MTLILLAKQLLESKFFENLPLCEDKILHSFILDTNSIKRCSIIHNVFFVVVFFMNLTCFRCVFSSYAAILQDSAMSAAIMDSGATLLV